MPAKVEKYSSKFMARLFMFPKCATDRDKAPAFCAWRLEQMMKNFLARGGIIQACTPLCE
jgi:hypothetical protein